MSLQCFLNPEWKSFFFFWFVFFSMWYQFRWKYFWSLLCQIFIVCDHNMIIILLKSIFSSTVIDTGISWLSIYPPLEFLYWKVYIFYVANGYYICVTHSSVQSLSRVRLFETPWITACQASLSITNSWSLLKLMSIESVMPSSHLDSMDGSSLCHPLHLLPPIPPNIRVFSNEPALHMRWPKDWFQL